MGEDKNLFVSQLKAIIACNQSDGFLKKWALDHLTKIEVRKKFRILRQQHIVLQISKQSLY